MLKIDQITFQYSELPIFSRFSLSVNRGEKVCLLGPSGRGKTTLFQLISGLLQPMSGRIEVEGKIAYQMQEDLLLPWKSVIENCLIFGGDANEALDLLDRVGLSGVLKSYPKELSKGMRQRAAFVRTLMLGFDFLLLDEPFSALDWATKEILLNLLDSRLETLLMITHDEGEANALNARRVYV